MKRQLTSSYKASDGNEFVVPGIVIAASKHVLRTAPKDRLRVVRMLGVSDLL